MQPKSPLCKFKLTLVPRPLQPPRDTCPDFHIACAPRSGYNEGRHVRWQRASGADFLGDFHGGRTVHRQRPPWLRGGCRSTSPLYSSRPPTAKVSGGVISDRGAPTGQAAAGPLITRLGEPADLTAGAKLAKALQPRGPST